MSAKPTTDLQSSPRWRGQRRTPEILEIPYIQSPYLRGKAATVARTPGVLHRAEAPDLFDQVAIAYWPSMNGADPAVSSLTLGMLVNGGAGFIHWALTNSRAQGTANWAARAAWANKCVPFMRYTRPNSLTYVVLGASLGALKALGLWPGAGMAVRQLRADNKISPKDAFHHQAGMFARWTVAGAAGAAAGSAIWGKRPQSLCIALAALVAADVVGAGVDKGWRWCSKLASSPSPQKKPPSATSAPPSATSAPPSATSALPSATAAPPSAKAGGTTK
ncbi:MAG: hypothetical protein IPK13_07300 [Deltaproteobacteria bacterium]|nr:hypothetical protein [Deltaproteobacteria bacterium]